MHTALHLSPLLPHLLLEHCVRVFLQLHGKNLQQHIAKFQVVLQLDQQMGAENSITPIPPLVTLCQDLDLAAIKVVSERN